MRMSIRKTFGAAVSAAVLSLAATIGLAGSSLAFGGAEHGLASWYGPGFHGKKTASGKTFNQHALTAAHRVFPLGTVVTVTNLANGRRVEVEIIDRGPHVGGRIIDLSRAAAQILDMVEHGIARVRIEVISEQRVAAADGAMPIW